MNGLQNLIVFYNNSDEDDIFHGIVGHLLKNVRMLEGGSIEDIAQKCYSSPATMSRLSRKLGYKGFSDFRTALLRDARQYSYLNRIIPIPSPSEKTTQMDSYFSLMQQQLSTMQSELDLDYLNEIVQKIHNMDRIYFYSYGYSFSEITLQQDLLIAGKQSMLFSRARDQLLNAKASDSTCFIIMLMPDTRDAIVVDDILSEAKKNGATVFLLTTSLHAYFLKYADYSYAFEGIGYIVDNYRMYMYIDLISLVYRDTFID